MNVTIVINNATTEDLRKIAEAVDGKMFFVTDTDTTKAVINKRKKETPLNKRRKSTMDAGPLNAWPNGRKKAISFTDAKRAVLHIIRGKKRAYTMKKIPSVTAGIYSCLRQRRETYAAAWDRVEWEEQQRLANGGKKLKSTHPRKGNASTKAKAKGTARKLSDKEVKYCRAHYAQGVTQTELCKKFGVSSPTMSHLVRGISYKHVK